MTPKIIGSYDKSEKNKAMESARVFSRTFKQTRVIVEDLPDAHGITLWKDSPRAHDNSEILLFLGGKRKQVKKYN